MSESGKILLRPVEVQRASEAIYEQIRTLILSDELKPGDKLPSEREMMDMLQRSRPTIREALRLLESEGFIKITPGSGGAIVQRLSNFPVTHALENFVLQHHVDNSELLEYRKLNEVAAAGWAAGRRTQADLLDISEHLCAPESAEEAYNDFILNDFMFRQAVIMAAHNHMAKIVDDLLNGLIYSTLAVPFHELPEADRSSMVQHVLQSRNDIYQAIQEQDVAGAEALMRRHIEIFAAKVDGE